MFFRGSTVLFVIFFICGLNASAHSVRAPIIFVPGLGVPWHAYEYIVPLQKHFGVRGFQVLVAHTPLGGDLKMRAQVLKSEIDRLVPNGPFHLVGHSQGGRDARMVVYLYELGNRALSVTTIATPHWGSTVADLTVSKLSKSRAGKLLFRSFGNSWKTIETLTTDYAREEFNPKVVDDPRVNYYSVSTYIPEDGFTLVPWLWPFHKIVKDAEGDNDGFVSLKSANWGESLGTFAADHYSQTAPVNTVWGGVPSCRIFLTIAERLQR